MSDGKGKKKRTLAPEYHYTKAKNVYGLVGSV